MENELQLVEALFEHFRQEFLIGRKFLLVEKGIARLVHPAKIYLNETPVPFLLDIQHSMYAFERLAGEQTVFSYEELGVIMGGRIRRDRGKYRDDGWFRQSLPTDEKGRLRFTMLDAVAAGVTSSLRRHKWPVENIKAVATFLYEQLDAIKDKAIGSNRRRETISV